MLGKKKLLFALGVLNRNDISKDIQRLELDAACVTGFRQVLIQRQAVLTWVPSHFQLALDYRTSPAPGDDCKVNFK